MLEVCLIARQKAFIILTFNLLQLLSKPRLSMSSKADVHVISKADIKDHAVVSVSESALSPLQDGHVRVRSAILSLGSNNFSYALLGSVRSWWDTYPVPSFLPAPYNDPDQYGICPAWGYGEVLESRVSAIESGTLLWGFWPTSNLPVDLRLVPADVAGHWIEVSEGRKTLMNLYQRYIVEDSDARLASLDHPKIEEMAWKAAFIVWEAGYLMTDMVFGSPSIHPLGEGKWDANDADLSRAVVISLSASGKTARAFTHGLVNRRAPNAKPLALLAITSNKDSNIIPEASFPTLTVDYDATADDKTMSWIARQQPSKIVLADFGGRGNSLQKLLSALEKSFSNVDLVIVGVGGSPQMSTQQELGQYAQKTMTLENRVQMNTSGVRDAAMEVQGADVYFQGLSQAWRAFIKSASVHDMKVEIGEGVAGENGLEGGWTSLCNGKLQSDVALAYRI